MITKIYLKNFRQFKDITVELNEEKNIFIGSNGAGKSSILSAIDLILSGSIKKIENATLESLFNSVTIAECVAQKENLQANDLPELVVELFFSECNNHKTFGLHNRDNRDCDGLRLEISPNEEFLDEILKLLTEEDNRIFPFEFYKIEFKTFSGAAYNSYNKPFKHAYMDSSTVSSPFAMRNFIQSNYFNITSHEERAKINNLYRKHGSEFNSDLSENYNNLILDDYKMVADNKGENAFVSKITANRNGVYLEDMGKGEATLINIQYILQRFVQNTDLILLEEPENHLSFVNMLKLVNNVSQYSNQLFISTHSDMIATRLNLVNAIFCHGGQAISLKGLNQKAANFFCKAPDQKVLHFILSPKIILVEGAAEYLLLYYLYKKTYGHEPHEDNVSIVECGGLTFKHYFEIARLFSEKKVCAIRDNDGDYEANITQNYDGYRSDNIEVFSDKETKRSTFEICLYEDNSIFYDEKIANANMTNGVLAFMLNNKVEAAFRTVEKLESEAKITFTPPQYILEAFEWIKE